MRRLLLLLATLVVMAPVPAIADHPIQQTGSGFHKAQSAPRQTIKVWQCPPCNLPPKTIQEWNGAATWSLFQWVTNKDNADVRVVPAVPGGHFSQSGTEIIADDSGTGNYELVRIYLEDQDMGGAYPTNHELGHALGFADHVYQYQFRPYFDTGANPRVCDNPDHWAYSPYKGIMSYCSVINGPTWFENQDKRMLYNLGYRPTPP